MQQPHSDLEGLTIKSPMKMRPLHNMFKEISFWEYLRFLTRVFKRIDAVHQVICCSSVLGIFLGLSMLLLFSIKGSTVMGDGTDIFKDIFFYTVVPLVMIVSQILVLFEQWYLIRAAIHRERIHNGRCPFCSHLLKIDADSQEGDVIQCSHCQQHWNVIPKVVKFGRFVTE